MTEFELHAEKNLLTIVKKSPMTSGSVNVYRVQFMFSPEWDGLSKRAVFRAGMGGEPIAVIPDEDGICDIPWEVLAQPGALLYAGVYGTKGDDVVLPTVWAFLGTILQGTAPGESGRPPTPDAWEQLQRYIKNLIGDIGSLLDEINGDSGQMTISDKLSLLRSTKAGIRSAIEEKGQTVGDIPFARYPDKIRAIETSGSVDIPVASHDTLGGVIPGQDFVIDNDGRLSINPERVLTPNNIAPNEDVMDAVDQLLNG